MADRAEVAAIRPDVVAEILVAAAVDAIVIDTVVVVAVVEDAMIVAIEAQPGADVPDRDLVHDRRHRNGARATRGLAHDRVHVIVQQCRVRPRDRHLQPGRRHHGRLVLHRVARLAHRQAALGRCHCRRYAVETVTTDSSIPSYPSTQLTRHKKNNNYDQLLCDCLKFAMLRDR